MLFPTPHTGARVEVWLRDDCCCSVAKSCPTLCDPMDHSMPGFPVLHCLPAAAAKSLQSCPTLCHPIDGSPPGSLVPGILQARTLEWVAISFSNAWRWKVKVKSLGRVQLLATPWTAAHQAPPSMGFARPEYWSGGHCLLRPAFLCGSSLPLSPLHVPFK